MGKIKLTVNDPGATRQALLAARGPISLDIETTGTEWFDHLVSVGLFLDDVVYILFTGSIASDVVNVPLPDALWALEPLARRDCRPVFGHNFGFDVSFLRRLGVVFGGPIHCTMQAMKLIDQDRGADGGDVYIPRTYRAYRKGLSSRTNYQLKDLVPRLTGVRMVGKPAAITTMAWLPRAEHLQYLASDVVGTRALYDFVMGEIDSYPWRLRDYFEKYCEPLTPILVQMRLDGFLADKDLIRSMASDLDAMVERLNAWHVRHHRASILTDSAVAEYLFGERAPSLGLPWLKVKRNASGRGAKPSLKREHLKLLWEHCAGDEAARRSVLVVSELRRAQSLSSKIEAMLNYIEGDGVIRSTLTDKQATGRISSSSPNLQQVAKAAKFDKVRLKGLPTVYKARDGLVARPGRVLVAMDLAQADVRVLANMVATAKRDHRRHIRELQEERMTRLNKLHPATRAIREGAESCRNPHAVREVAKSDEGLFKPGKSQLLEDFLNPGAQKDFYTVAATTMFGRPPADKDERNHCKQTILGLINLMGPDTLSTRIGKGDPKELLAKAKELMARFQAAYPNDLAYRDMIEEQIAVSGETETYAGRRRRDSSHYWMVSLPQVEIMVDMGKQEVWLDVCPVRPYRYGLTCFINAAYEWQGYSEPLGVKFFTAAQGRLVHKPYAVLDTFNMEFNLPYRNIAWHCIRRVRTKTEEVEYKGLDKTIKPLFNHICQGGTADAAKWMMIRAQPLLRQYAARILMQIHDELVFEIPEEWHRQFARDALRVLQNVPGFKLPMMLEPKVGLRFGSLVDLKV